MKKIIILMCAASIILSSSTPIFSTKGMHQVSRNVKGASAGKQHSQRLGEKPGGTSKKVHLTFKDVYGDIKKTCSPQCAASTVIVATVFGAAVIAPHLAQKIFGY